MTTPVNPVAPPPTVVQEVGLVLVVETSITIMDGWSVFHHQISSMLQRLRMIHSNQAGQPKVSGGTSFNIHLTHEALDSSG